MRKNKEIDSIAELSEKEQKEFFKELQAKIDEMKKSASGRKKLKLVFELKDDQKIHTSKKSKPR